MGLALSVVRLIQDGIRAGFRDGFKDLKF